MLENPQSERVRTFVDYLQSQRTCHANIYVIRLVSLHGKQLLPLTISLSNLDYSLSLFFFLSPLIYKLIHYSSNSYVLGAFSILYFVRSFVQTWL